MYQTNTIINRFRSLNEPCRALTDLLWLVGYTPEPTDEGYTSVELIDTVVLDDDRMLITFVDYSTPAAEFYNEERQRVVLLSLDREDDQLVIWGVVRGTDPSGLVSEVQS